jgi:hypothetical protein
MSTTKPPLPAEIFPSASPPSWRRRVVEFSEAYMISLGVYNVDFVDKKTGELVVVCHPKINSPVTPSRRKPK